MTTHISHPAGQDAAPRRGPGDVGRRVAWRRQELGLTPEQLAERAGMSPSFITLLEHNPVNITSGSVIRLTTALRITPDALLGGETEPPIGAGPGAPYPALEILSQEECLRLIAPGGVGRVVYVSPAGPEALPVNYVLEDAGRGVLFRAREHGVFARHLGGPVGFEVDRIDEPLRAGWSVLVGGWLRQMPLAPARLRESIPVTPWAGGDRHWYLRIEIERISGRRIRT